MKGTNEGGGPAREAGDSEERQELQPPRVVTTGGGFFMAVGARWQQKNLSHESLRANYHEFEGTVGQAE